MSDALTQTIGALGLEVAAIRKRGGGTQVERHGSVPCSRGIRGASR